MASSTAVQVHVTCSWTIIPFGKIITATLLMCLCVWRRRGRLDVTLTLNSTWGHLSHNSGTHSSFAMLACAAATSGKRFKLRNRTARLLANVSGIDITDCCCCCDCCCGDWCCLWLAGGQAASNICASLGNNEHLDARKPTRRATSAEASDAPTAGCHVLGSAR